MEKYIYWKKVNLEPACLHVLAHVSGEPAVRLGRPFAAISSDVSYDLFDWVSNMQGS